jgi:hypothetical protein
MRLIGMTGWLLICFVASAAAQTDENGWRGIPWGSSLAMIKSQLPEGRQTTSDGKAYWLAQIMLAENKFGCALELGDSDDGEVALRLKGVVCTSIDSVSDSFLKEVNTVLSNKYGFGHNTNPKNPLYEFGLEIGPTRFGDKRNRLYSGPYIEVETRITSNQGLMLKYTPKGKVGNNDL